MQFTKLQTLRQYLELDKQDLRRFLADRAANAESIDTVKRTVEAKEAKIAMHIS
jgi:hypothetical protein